MRIIKKGSTSQSIYFSILDSASTTGGKKTGLVFNTSSLTAYYVLNAGSATAITLATLAAANSAFSSGGFKEVDATNMPGLYRLDVPNAALTGADSVVISLKGATGMVQVDIEIQLAAVDLQDTVRAGLTALPNAAAEAAGGLYTRGTGAGQINQPANGRVDVNTIAVSGTTQTAGDIPARLPAALTANGNMKSSVLEWISTTFTEGATGRIAAAIQQFFNIASPTSTMNLLTTVTTATNLTNAPSDSSGVTTLLTRVPSGIFTGITSLAQWLGLIAGKQTGNSTARTEVRATGGGSGTYDETTDSMEALRDNTGTAGAGLTVLSTAANLTALAGKFTGITLLAEWLGIIAGKQTGNTTARTEIRATGAGSGTFDETTDSLEAQKDLAATSADLADAVLDEVVLGSYTMRHLLRGIAAATMGKASGAATTTMTFRSANDAKDVIVATVDSSGNRTAVTLDLT